MTDLTDFTPVADVLVIEHRICRKCSFGSYVPAGVYRLFTSHTGPHRHALERREPDAPPHDVQGTRLVETVVESCTVCWKGTGVTWADLTSIVPLPPSPEPRALTPFASKLEAALSRAAGPGVSREARERMAKTLAPRPKITLASILSKLEARSPSP
jgi:hypothetical protein